MANRHVMIPEDVWRGMLSSNRGSAHTGDINLDTARQDLDAIKQGRLNPATKGILYNDQLRRYLHLRKEHENRPVKVEVVAGPNAALVTTNNPNPPAMIYADGNGDGGGGGNDDDDDGWIEDAMSFRSYITAPPSIGSVPSFPASAPSLSNVARGSSSAPPSAGPSLPNPYRLTTGGVSVTPSQRSRATTSNGNGRQPRRVKRRRQTSNDGEDDEPADSRPTKQAKLSARRRGIGARQRRRRQRTIRKKDKQRLRQNMQDAMNAPLPDNSADDLLLLDQQPGPSNPSQQPRQPTIAERRGFKRRPLLSMRPPPFYGGKRVKRNPPKKMRRAETGTPPPTKIFRPSFWQ